MNKTDLENRVKGGLARAAALTPEERSIAARRAAVTRWNGEIPDATHEGGFRIGSTEVSAAVLPGGVRVITQATMLRAIGRSRSPKAGTGVLSTVDGLPFFLQAETLKPFISKELASSTSPIFFLDKSGKRAVGYNAELLPQVAEVYLKLRDAHLEGGKPVPKHHAHIIRACDVVVRGLARVGIVALVDEATGYQAIRDKGALQAILDKYLAKEFAAWAKRFPDEFYREMFRLRKWEWRGMKPNRPQCVANYTNDIVYERLAPGIVEELQLRNPKDENGNRKVRHHQWLTEDIGNPALSQHLHATIAFMKASDSWEGFKRMLDRAFPRKGANLVLPLPEPGR